MLNRVALWGICGLFVLLCLPLVLLGLVFMPLGWLIEEVSGEAKWFRGQRRRMVDERPPLPDADLVRSEALGADDAPLWLAVRGAVAESLGFPRESIYPGDQLTDLWRMLAPLDVLDLVFRIERSLGVKIHRELILPCFYSQRGLRQGEFREFLSCVAGVLRGLPACRLR